jgi:hypothetical protein
MKGEQDLDLGSFSLFDGTISELIGTDREKAKKIFSHCLPSKYMFKALSPPQSAQSPCNKSERYRNIETPFKILLLIRVI